MGGSVWPNEPRYDLIDLIEGEHRTVLDVGCWTGHTMEELNLRGHKAFGMDIADKRTVAKSLPFYKNDLDESLIGPKFLGQFHYVLMADVLEHLKHPARVLAMLARGMQKAGRIIVSVPNIGWIGALLPIVRGESLRSDAGIFDRTHLRIYNGQTLKDEVEAAGFRVLEIAYRHFKGTDPFPSEGERHVFQFENVAIDCTEAMYDALCAYQILLVAEVA